MIFGSRSVDFEALMWGGIRVKYLAATFLGSGRGTVGKCTVPKFRCHPGKPNQRKASSWTFPGGIPEQKFNVNRPCFPGEKHPNSQKWAKFMNFSFWPFLWFGLPGRLPKNGPNNHFGQNDLIPNRILALARPKWTEMVHFGLFWPQDSLVKRPICVHLGPPTVRTLAIPDFFPGNWWTKICEKFRQSVDTFS